MRTNAREAILSAAKATAQARGYGGLNFRDLADDVGVKAASIHYYFPSKADLGAAVARRYWEDTATALEALSAERGGDALRLYPSIFRKALENGNRMCLCSFMAAEYDDLPEAVKTEVQAFADVNVAWLSRALAAGEGGDAAAAVARARAIFSALSGAQLLARSRADLALYDAVVDSFRQTGLLPG